VADESAARQDPSAPLLERWQRTGDLEALDELLRIEVAILRDRIRARGKNLLSPSISSSDVAQEVVLNLFKVKETPSFEEPAALRAYLWTSAWRLLGAHFERHGRRTRRLDASQSRSASAVLAASGGLSSVEGEDHSLALELALHLLSDDDREILEHVYFRERTVEAAAKELAITNEAAKKRVARARRRLAEKIGHWSELIG
jgi:RNA polymerase sigma factor (sigma-70 family)